MHIGVVTRSVLMCLVTAGLGVAYVWQKNQIYRLGDEVKKREVALVAAQKRNTMLAAQLAQLKSPAVLDSKCQQYGLGLVAPRESQMIRLLEPGPEWDHRLLPAVQPAISTKPQGAKKPAAQPRQMVAR